MSYHKDANDQSYLSKLEALLAKGKKPSELIPFKRNLKTFAEYFVKLVYGRKDILGLTLGDIVLLIVWHATGWDMEATALELDYDSVEQLKYDLKMLRRKLGIKERSTPTRKKKPKGDMWGI